MVFAYIGIGIAILVAIFLLKKILFPSNSFEMFCQKCGTKTDGLKCSRCTNRSNKYSWR
ncbi:MAG: class I SAM-dependent methyltransferase [Thaumarchaeota archaeon]|nr:class I SAM-dependent methyltransferase [Nitrososphaerota archaeon]